MVGGLSRDSSLGVDRGSEPIIAPHVVVGPKADMLAKLGVVEEVADESGYWLEVIQFARMMPEDRIAPLLKEADEFVAKTVASIKRLRSRK